MVPAGTDGSTKDIVVYDNVTAVVETPDFTIDLEDANGAIAV